MSNPLYKREYTVSREMTSPIHSKLKEDHTGVNITLVTHRLSPYTKLSWTHSYIVNATYQIRRNKPIFIVINLFLQEKRLAIYGEFLFPFPKRKTPIMLRNSRKKPDNSPPWPEFLTK